MNKKILLIGLVFLLCLVSTSLPLAFAVGTAPDPADIVAYWAMEDLTDEVGTYTLTNNAGASSITGKILNGYDFDGSTTGLKATDLYDAIDSDGVYSIGGWIYPDSVAGNVMIASASNTNGDYFNIKPGGVLRVARNSVGVDETGASISAGVWQHVMFVFTSTANVDIYVDGIFVESLTISSSTTPTSLNIGRYSDATAFHFDGKIDEFLISSEAFTADEVLYLAQGGSDQQYPFAAGPTSDEVIPQVVEVTPNISTDVLSTTYVDIYSTIFQPINDTSVYTAFTLSTEALNKAMTSTCRVTYDGVDYGSEKNRTLANGEIGNLYLFTDEFNATAGVNTTVTLQCKSPTTGGRQLITDVEGMINIMTAVDGTPIVHEHNQGILQINSTSYQPLFNTTIESSNLTGSDLELIFAADGRIGYNYDNASTISLYATIDGTSSAVFERGGAAGTSGSGSGLSLIKNVTPLSNITFTIYGKSTSGDGSVDISSVLSEFFMHTFESSNANLSGITLPKTATWTTVETIYVNNTNHATGDIIIKASISAKDTTSTCVQSYRIKAGTTFSQEYDQTLGSFPRVSTLQHVLANPGSVNQSIELQTSNDCGAPNTISATGGSLMAYMGFEIANTPQFYTVTARDIWDNATINTFNVTTDAGASFTTTTGSIDIYHVNSLQSFNTSAVDYFDTQTIDHDTTTDAVVDMRQTDIKFIGKEILTLNNLTGNVTVLSTQALVSTVGAEESGTSGTVYGGITQTLSISVTFAKDGIITQVPVRSTTTQDVTAQITVDGEIIASQIYSVTADTDQTILFTPEDYSFLIPAGKIALITVTGDPTTLNFDNSQAYSGTIFSFTSSVYPHTSAGTPIKAIEAEYVSETKSTETSFYLKAGTYEATFTRTGYFDRTQNFTVTALQNETLNFTNLGDSQLKINATNAQTGAAELAFNFSFQFNGTELDTYEVTGGEVNISLLQGYNYTIFINDSLHALQYFYITPDVQYYNETLVLSEINSILIRFYDEVSGLLINGTNMTASVIGANDYILTTTNGTIYQNLIVPQDYEIRYYSTLVDDYKLRSAFFTLSPLSFQEINLYSLNTTLNETDPAYTAATITFIILDNSFQPVENAKVVVQRYYTLENGFVSIFERLSNSVGEAVGIFETIDAFYKYNVYVDDVLKFSSSSNGVQFVADDTITIYIDTSTSYGDTFDAITDLADVSTLDFVSTGNFTGYFQLDYTNTDLIQICLNVTDGNGVKIDGECQTTAAGSIQLSVSAPSTTNSIYTASAYGYDTITDDYILFDQKTKSFNVLDLLGNNEDINTAALFVAVIILTAIALVLIQYPVIALLAQALVFIFMVLSPIPFLLGAPETTLAWILSVIITAMFILVRGRNE